jgi:hypothetical protein
MHQEQLTIHVRGVLAVMVGVLSVTLVVLSCLTTAAVEAGLCQRGLGGEQIVASSWFASCEVMHS